MSQSDFYELAGRIEGLTRVVMLLVEDADYRGLIDSEQFTASLRKFSADLCFAGPHLQTTKTTLINIADEIDLGCGSG